MDKRNLEITFISVGGLKSSTKIDTSFVSHTGGNKLQSQVLTKTRSSKLPLNFSKEFTIDEAMALKGDLNLLIKFKVVKWMFFGKIMGEVRVPIKDLMEGITEEGKESRLVSYPVVNQKAGPGASLTFSYKFGKKFLQKVTKSGSELEKSIPGFAGQFHHVVEEGCGCGKNGGSSVLLCLRWRLQLSSPALDE